MIDVRTQTKQANIDDWTRIYRLSTDPDIIANNKREAERRVRAEQKRKDTGL